MDNFNELMFEALDETLRLMLGERVSKLIHSLTERQASLKPKEIGNNIDVIISHLERLLGKEGAQIIQTVSILGAGKPPCWRLRLRSFYLTCLYSSSIC